MVFYSVDRESSETGDPDAYFQFSACHTDNKTANLIPAVRILSSGDYSYGRWLEAPKIHLKDVRLSMHLFESVHL